MRNLRYFCGLLLGFAGAACLWVTAVWWQTGVATPSSQWTFNIISIKMRAANAELRSKLLVLGGSSTLFGIDARQIRSETGIQAVNFGVHGALGIRYLLYLAEKTLRPGDTVLLVFEYPLYKDDDDLAPLDYVYSRDPQYLADLPASRRWKLPFYVSILRLREGLTYKIRPGTPLQLGGECYSAASLDEFGDTICNRSSSGRSPQAFLSQGLLWPSSAPAPGAAFETIRNFHAWAGRRGVRVLATYPSTLRKPEYDDPSWAAFFAQLSDFYRSIDVPVLGSPKDFMYDSSWFFDTPHHLTSLGMHERTKQLIVLLRPYW